jgi:hypothetical protein
MSPLDLDLASSGRCLVVVLSSVVLSSVLFLNVAWSVGRARSA